MTERERLETNNLRPSENIITEHKNQDILFRESSLILALKIFISLMLFALTIFLQSGKVSENKIAGVVAQFQVMISTYLVVAVKKKGYPIAVVLNITISLITFTVFLKGNDDALPGILVPIITILTISIISFFERRLNHRLQILSEQTQELTGLYKELVIREDEIEDKNIQLMRYNDLLKEKEEKLNELAYIDILTEIPNRKMIINRLELLSNMFTSTKENFAVVLISLDDFKRINDTKGYQTGDFLLRSVVSRLLELKKEEDLIGRMGGDEFALIIQHEIREEALYEYVESIRKEINKALMMGEETYHMSASLGISIYPKDGTDIAQLLMCADIAVVKAKVMGKNRAQFYDKQINDEIQSKIEFESKLLNSLNNKELFLMYQPQYTLEGKQLIGFEALARWKSPELGLVSPVKFIPIAEEIGFINRMGEWILKTACQLIHDIQEAYDQNIVISVNISSIQIMNPNFVNMVKHVLRDTQIKGSLLEMEITESVFISSMEYVVGVIQQLKELGIRFALDDFGTGYSSLSYLQRLPLNRLKIDKSFVDSINIIEDEKQIMGSMIALLHTMDMQVVAEGVENESQLMYLREHHCDYIQGFLWGKPLEDKDVFDLLDHQ